MAVSGSGQIVIIKRDGTEGSSYPLISGNLTIGSGRDCDIRVVSRGFPQKQCIITIHNTEAFIKNLSTETPTVLNGKVIQFKVLCEGDVISFKNSKFKWKYNNKKQTSARKFGGESNRPSYPIKYTPKNFPKRKSEPYVRKVDSQKQSDNKTRNSISHIQAPTTPKTRQVAVVMPQRRNTELPEKSMMPDRQRGRAKSEAGLLAGRSHIRRLANNNLYDNFTFASGSKIKKSQKVEKVEDPGFIDENKKAALMLLTRSPNNRNIFKSNISRSDSTKKTPIKPSTNIASNPLTKRKVFSESKIPVCVCDKSKIPVTSARKSMATRMKPIIATPARVNQMKKSGVNGSHSKNVSFNLELNYSDVSNSKKESPDKALTGNMRLRNSKINSPGRYAILSGRKPRNSNHISIKNASSELLFDISGVEVMSDNESILSQKSIVSPETKKNISVNDTPKSADFPNANSTQNVVTESLKKITPVSGRSNRSRKSLNMSNSTDKIYTPENLLNISMNLNHMSPLVISNHKKSQKTPRLSSSQKSYDDIPAAVESFISTLTNALNVVNNSNADLQSVAKTPEYQALSNQIRSIGKMVNLSTTKSPSPVLLEIGKTRKSKSANNSVNITPNHLINSSPIISPKNRLSLTPTDSKNHMDDIITTPNLSKLFEVDSSTPMDSRKSVSEKIKHFESKFHNSPPNNVARVTRKSSFIVNEKRLIFEPRKRGLMTEPRNNIGRITKNKNRRSLQMQNRRKFNNSVKDVSSDDSNVTDVNAPKTENEIVITPKSTIKPMPEVVKEKHSTAKKSVSRKTLIDQLAQSPHIAKELFKSPVKRKLSQSMRHHSTSRTFDDVQDINPIDATHDTSFSLLVGSTRMSVTNNSYSSTKSSFNNSYNLNLTNQKSIKSLRTPVKANTTPTNNKNSPRFERSNSKTPINPNQSPTNNSVATKNNKSPKNDLRNVSGLKQLLRSPRKSPKNDLTDVVGVSRLLRSPKIIKSPKNDLRDVRGVKKLLKTPKVQKSPRNDLTNVKGIRDILLTPSKFYNSPKNDLTNVQGLRALLKTPGIVKSPKNDLRNVSGVKKLLKTPKVQKSPENNLTIVKGVRTLLSSPKLNKSPKNDLTDVLGVKRLLKTPRKMKSPKNDLRIVAGVKKLLRTPFKKGKQPKNELSNISGLEELFSESNNSIRNISRLSNVSKNTTPKSEDLFDTLVGKTPIRTYSNSKRLNISPAKGVASKSNETLNRSRRQATIEQTSFSKEVSKVLFKKKDTKEDESTFRHSTPAPKKLNAGNVTDIRELSPIVNSTSSKSPIKRGSVKKAKLVVKVNSPINISPRKTRVTRGAKNVAVQPVKKTTNTTKTTVNKEENVVVKKTTRAKKVTKKDEAQPIEKSLESSISKKKVTFASDVKMKSAEDLPAKPKSTRKTSTATVEVPSIEQRSRRGTTVASSKASDAIAKIAKSPKKTAGTKATIKKAKSKVVATKKVIKTVAKTNPSAEISDKTVKTSKRSAAKNITIAVAVPDTPVKKGRKAPAAKPVTADKKKKGKTDEAPAVSLKVTKTSTRGKKNITKEVAPPKSNAKSPKTNKPKPSSPLILRRTRATSTRKCK